MAKPKVYDDGLDNNRKLEAAKRRLQERYQEAENGLYLYLKLSFTLIRRLQILFEILPNCSMLHLCSQKAAHDTSNGAGRHTKAQASKQTAYGQVPE